MKLPVGPKGSVGPFKETNNHKQGRSGSKVPIHRGPAAGGSLRGNPTMSGGINRATKGKR